MSGQWNFKRLPREEHALAIELEQAQDWNALRQLHNKYELSGTRFCCEGALEQVRIWFQWAIMEGVIYE